MKRNVIIVSIFLLLSLLLISTSCTCYGTDGSEIRGLGYTCGTLKNNTARCINCFSCGICVGDDEIEYMNAKEWAIGVADIDYKIQSFQHTQEGQIDLTMDIITAHAGSPWNIQVDIWALQKDSVVGKTVLTFTADKIGTYNESIWMEYNEFYVLEKGRVDFIINSTVVKRSVG